MGRPPQAGGRRPKITINPGQKILDWVDRNSGEGKRFYNRTHAFEVGIARLMEADRGDAGKQG
jgi:hypothetical protein